MKPLQDLLRRAWPDALVVVLFLLVGFAYFHEPISQDLVLNGHDAQASVGLGHEQQLYRASHNGETTRWSNAVFSGMPTYQTAPSYGATQFLGKVAFVYGLGTSGVLSYAFLLLLGFYILLRAFSVRPLTAALGAVAWAFSSYFFIIIAAGHLWKVMTLAFIPPTLAGLILCYRGKLLWGGALTALFTAFQVQANHLQMTYYFAFLMGFLVLAYGVQALRKKTWRAYLRQTGVVVVAGLLGIAANLPNLYHTYSYAAETMRAGSELSAQKTGNGASAKAASGLERSYITAWSYGIDETLTLLIPDYKGGGSFEVMLDNPAASSNDDYLATASTIAQQTGGIFPGYAQYWGEQPMTVGPVYAGAILCFLFLLGLFYVRGPVKWALAAATLLSLLFAWGHNVNALTNFFIDYLPLYNKFRTVSSALVVAELCIPLLGVLCVAQILQRPQVLRERPVPFYLALALTAGTCLLLWLAPALSGDCIASAEREGFAYLSQYFPDYQASVTQVRHAVLAASALRSGLLILLCAGLLILYQRGLMKGGYVVAILLVATLADMWTENRRYLNDESFADRTVQAAGYEQKTAADEAILRDTTYYRVLNLSAGNPFNETSNRTSYYHKSIGGYHAAKLRRYQDLIDRRLMPEVQQLASHIALPATGDLGEVAGDSLCPVLNALNARYLIVRDASGAERAVRNTGAMGNGWFVTALDFVRGANAEMEALGRIDLRTAAVADETFLPQLKGEALDSGTVRLTSYAPNALGYEVDSKRGGVVVFSEVYYPGWTVTIDGAEATCGRADYLLRALRVPAGKHAVQFTFRPASVDTTNGIAYGAIVLILLLFAFALWQGCRSNFTRAQ